MSFLFRNKTDLPDPADALPGRDSRPFEVPSTHFVLGTPLEPPFPEDTEQVIVGMGCFWGAERVFWQAPGMYTTAVGYAGGYTPNPTYEEVCTGRTGHNEVVLAVFRPAEISFDEVLRLFWENHDPTQGMRQGNDMGTQYRSAIYYSTPEQEMVAQRVTERYQPELTKRGYGEITTEIKPASETPYYYAEDHHQQYLLKNPFGYRCHSATGIPVPRG